MGPVSKVWISALKPERFAEILSDDAYAAFGEAVSSAGHMLDGRTVWNINSTGKGGGVAEMLVSLIAYAQGAGVDARWAVIGGNPSFFQITKRIHNNLHGSPGDGGPLGEAEHQIYMDALRPNAEQLTDMISERDVVILHDPQTAGLIESVRATGAKVIWRCHVGLDHPNDHARTAWDFLRPHVQQADRYVFSRRAFAWEELEDDRIVVIAPSIDAFSPKNQEMEPSAVQAILSVTGLSDTTAEAPARFLEMDGSEALVQRKVEMYGAPAVPVDAPLVVQVSRWDRLKDPLGVMRGFVSHVRPNDAHLMLAGPSVADVADDPEGAEVLKEAHAYWSELPPSDQERVHLACLPMDDLQENAAIVNALQRRADVIVQKSLAEGFGLTVAEGMWKGRPVVATRIGGIQDQIEHGRTGLLIDDPHDLDAFGATVSDLLNDRRRADEMGAAAKENVRNNFLGPRHLMQYLELIGQLIG